MRWITRAAPLIGIAGLGALVIHQVAYLLAAPLDEGAAGDHGHMATLWSFAVPVGIVGAVVAILRQVHQLGYRNPVGATRLAVLMAVAFTAQESIEFLVAGHHLFDLAKSPALWLGLVISPLMALVFSRVLGHVTELIRNFVATPHRPVAVSREAWIPAVQPALRLALVARAPSRGPPRIR